ncbi:hypothetical protein DEB41_06980 [Vibrio anguillarum]|uniref:Uncharacterized protein n=1 Tax=Vibrio anguillarum TaxID=55601 RepID=A0AAW4AYH9_VIBAN|nr:hypothetical protein [Vibrio anguillarum]AEH33039.1 hypothetical protein VAA_03016 [Vibrio anguillarum 775]AGU57560.1 hypothetical protein N175_07450 [Vibrio anguillarum M3]ASF92001.1 hypothetical protein CEA93_08090 [Vibrio anguillarum]ATA49342.1 hypothetical protein CLI14_06215 [Vibrio anguillarum]AVT67963.1 hypothetical protein B5S57_12505 [Vibrio anguillarum]
MSLRMLVMKCWKYVNKTIGILSLLLIITLLIQFYLATSFTPSFVNKTETVISKVVLTYGEEKQDSRYREVSYTLVPFFLNRYGLLANIKFDSGESVKTQFLITFWPFNEYSIKFISKLVDKEQVRFFDRPEQHILFDGGDEEFQVLPSDARQYCYVQLSDQAIQCVDVNSINGNK